MTKRKSEEPDDKASERLKQFREARGIPEEDRPEKEAETPEGIKKQTKKTDKKDERTK